MTYWYPRYVPVGVRRAQAARALRDMRARGQSVQPVELLGRAITRSFWGRRWCEHLESFSDYANRLPRGRTYVRNGAVCHLAIDPGGVEALVAGRALYRVVVRIRTLKRPAWKAIKAACAGQIGSVLELLQGRLSDHVMEVVTDRGAGLFPKPGEIELACDCPDWATMCKHAAAVLYGVGSRLDDSPELLFRLRGVDEAELIAADLTLPRGAPSADTLADGDLGSIFGIDLDAEDPPVASATSPGPTQPPSPAAATGAEIAELRESCGFSVAEFAGLLRVSAATVRRWEDAPGPLVLRGRTREALAVLRDEVERQEE